MIRFLLKKLGYGILVLLGVVLVVFLLFMALPDPARMTLGQRSDVMSLEAINQEFGLDKPLSQQFVLYINDLSPISLHENTDQNQTKYDYWPVVSLGQHVLVLKAPYLRRSYQSKKQVSAILLESLKGTFILALAAIFIASVLGITFGVLAALRKNSWLDQLMIFITTIGISLPSFFAAIIMAWLFGFLWDQYTGLSMTGSLYDYDGHGNQLMIGKNLILPAVALGIRPLAIITQLTRSSMLEVLSQDYIRTAKAKGLSQWQVVKKHALRNALNPVLTAVSGWFASLMSGAFFVEFIFNWKGIGKVTVDALEKSDFPVVSGAVLVVAFLFVLINIIVDLLYGFLDPRVSVE